MRVTQRVHLMPKTVNAAEPLEMILKIILKKETSQI